MGLVSCSKESHVIKGEANTDFILESLVRVRTSTENLTELSFKSGIVKLDVIETGGKIMYKPITASNVIVNGRSLDFGSLSFVLEDNFLTIASKSGHGISITEDHELFIKSIEYNGLLKDMLVDDIDENTAVLLLFLNEILATDIDSKTHYAAFHNKYNRSPNVINKGTLVANAHGIRHCGSNWAIDVGIGRSALEMSFQRDLAETDFYNGCAAVGGIDVTCLFGGNHGCVATQQYNCPC